MPDDAGAACRGGFDHLGCVDRGMHVFAFVFVVVPGGGVRGGFFFSGCGRVVCHAWLGGGHVGGAVLWCFQFSWFFWCWWYWRCWRERDA